MYNTVFLFDGDTAVNSFLPMEGLTDPIMRDVSSPPVGISDWVCDRFIRVTNSVLRSYLPPALP